MSREPVHVSDHAVLRYVERVLGIDVRQVRREIRRAAINGSRHGASAIRVAGVSYCLQYKVQDNGAVVTTVWVGPRDQQGDD